MEKARGPQCQKVQVELKRARAAHLGVNLIKKRDNGSATSYYGWDGKVCRKVEKTGERLRFAKGRIGGATYTLICS